MLLKWESCHPQDGKNNFPHSGAGSSNKSEWDQVCMASVCTVEVAKCVVTFN